MINRSICRQATSLVSQWFTGASFLYQILCRNTNSHADQLVSWRANNPFISSPLGPTASLATPASFYWMIPSLSDSNDRLCHIIRHHFSPLSSPISPSLFHSRLKTYLFHPSHHIKLVTTWLPFTDSLTFSDFLCSSVSILVLTFVIL